MRLLIALLVLGDLVVLRLWLRERRAHAKSRRALDWWRTRVTGRGKGEAA